MVQSPIWIVNGGAMPISQIPPEDKALVMVMQIKLKQNHWTIVLPDHSIQIPIQSVVNKINQYDTFY